jgi:hypothetical protein
VIELNIEVARWAQPPAIDEKGRREVEKYLREQIYLVSLALLTPANQKPKSYGTWTCSTPYFLGTGLYFIGDAAPLSLTQSSRFDQQRIPLNPPLALFFYAKQEWPFLVLGDFRTQALTCSQAMGFIKDYKLFSVLDSKVVYEAKYISDGNSAPPAGCGRPTASTSGRP